MGVEWWRRGKRLSWKIVFDAADASSTPKLIRDFAAGFAATQPGANRICAPQADDAERQSGCQGSWHRFSFSPTFENGRGMKNIREQSPYEVAIDDFMQAGLARPRGADWASGSQG